MIVKVCGMRDPENIRAVSELDIQWLGMIFWEKSSRYVSEKPSFLPTKQKRVGVFVDADIEDILGKVREYALDIIQLHGKESPAYIRRLRPLCDDRVAAIIKALNIATAEDLEQTKPYMDVVDYFLFDTKAKMVGGNGTKFDWSVLSEYNGTTPFILSGGIGPDDADKVKAFHHPQLAGIDLNSRFETAPGLKDIEKLKHFIYEQNQ
ncbi:MAG: phosphoribosylanthranilate isomerase [Prevotella sp.]|nr:phosphoribosylanthranilate isomerase [Prevotella sp.]